MESLPTIKVNEETAHSLYTTNDRGVNEVVPRKIPRGILVREDKGSVHQTTSINENRMAESDQHDPQQSRRGFNDLHHVRAQKQGPLNQMYT
jgi:hypothetical protein